MARDWIPIDRVGSAKVGPKGQIVIPKAMRDRAGMKPGGHVFLSQAEDGSITVEHAWNDVHSAPDYFARFPTRPGMEGKSSIDILHEMDAEDEAILERKYGQWTEPTSSTPNPSSRSSSASPTGGKSAVRSRRRSAVRSSSD